MQRAARVPPPEAARVAGKLYPLGEVPRGMTPSDVEHCMVQTTGVCRPPRAGELYVDTGSEPPGGMQAQCDYTVPLPIAKLVRVGLYKYCRAGRAYLRVYGQVQVPPLDGEVV